MGRGADYSNRRSIFINLSQLFCVLIESLCLLINYLSCSMKQFFYFFIVPRKCSVPYEFHCLIFL